MQDQPDMTAKAPLVSVVVVSYNHAKFIECCLRSVMDQSYSNIECIVVDNASTDNSAEVIEAFRQKFDSATEGRSLEIIFSPTNLQLTKGMITGFRRARGAYVAFIDGDDYYLPTCIETHIRAHLVSRIPVGASSVDIYQSRDADLVTGARSSFTRFISSGRGQTKPFCRMDRLESFGLSRLPGGCPLEERDLHWVDRQSGSDWNWSPTVGLLFRREAVELMFAYEPKILTSTDAYLVRGISAMTGSIVIDRPLAVYRQHGSNVFTTHPSLMHFCSHDKVQLAKYETGVAEEIIECFRSQAAQLAARLEWHETFIQAIATVSTIGPGLRAKPPLHSYTLSFLVENRDTLVAAFGAKIYRHWLFKYARHPLDRWYVLQLSLKKDFRVGAAAAHKPVGHV
jgi:glycosyltransferase involved in cell wall biosynthesis